MKKYLYILATLLFFGILTTNATSCRTGYGCPAEEAYEKGQDQKMSTKRGKSKLFKNSN